MRLAEAADQWLEAKAELADAQSRVDEAAEVLKAHFRRSGRAAYRGVSYRLSHIRALDTAKVREHLGKRVAEFERVADRETLSAVDAA